MKKLLGLLGLIALSAQAQFSPPAASQAEVDAGVVKNKYVSPATLSTAILSFTNAGITSSQSTNIANYLIGQSNALYIANLNGLGTNTSFYKTNIFHASAGATANFSSLGFMNDTGYSTNSTVFAGWDARDWALWMTDTDGANRAPILSVRRKDTQSSYLIVPNNSDLDVTGYGYFDAGLDVGQGNTGPLHLSYDAATPNGLLGILNGDVYSTGIDPNSTITTNNSTLSSGFLLGGNGARGATNVAVGTGLTLSGGVLSASGSSSSLWGSNSVTGNLTNSGLGVRVLGPNGFGVTNNTIADGQFITWSTNGVLTNNGSVGVSGSLTVGGASVLSGSTNFVFDEFAFSPASTKRIRWTTNFTSATGLNISTPSDYSTPGVAMTLSRNSDGANVNGFYTYATSGGAKQNLAYAAKNEHVFTTGGIGGGVERMRISDNGVVYLGAASATNGFFGDSLQLFNRTTVPTTAIGTGGSNVTVLNLGTNLVAIWTNVAAGGYNTNWLTGKEISSTIPFGSAVSLSSTVAANVTSITITPGTWACSANVNFPSSTSFQVVGMGITTSSATLPTDGSEVYGAAATGSTTAGCSKANKIITVTSDTTIYLVAYADFSAGTVSAYGSLVAIREH